MGNRKAVTLAVAGAVTLLTGCGSGKHYANAPRPAELLNLTAAIADGHVVVSPNKIGAGPVDVTVANETAASQQISITSSDGSSKLLQTGPINPGSTASVKAQITPGTYSVSTQDSTIRGATIQVGAQRQSTQNVLLEP
jgi:anti-sigma28 factor (negative regulator of flagellin synthesis)